MFLDEKPFGFDDIGHRRPKGNTTWANLNLLYPGIHGSSSYRLNVMPMSVNQQHTA
jgi:hypothetical protein